jgi:putative flippase GtrA
LGYRGVAHYEIANAAAWVLSMGLGFVLKRALTCRLSGPENRAGQLARFVVGSVGHLIISTFGFWVLMGPLHLSAWAAFPINVVFTSTYMFTYLESVPFRNGTVELR